MVNTEHRAAHKPEAGGWVHGLMTSVWQWGLAFALIILPVTPRRKREDLLVGVSLERIAKSSIYYVVPPN